MPDCSQCGAENADNAKYCFECGFNLSGATGKLDPDSVLENRYVIVKVLGRGGMGAVYQAVDQRLKNTLVAVKEMSTNALGKDNRLGAISAFEKEATMLIGLRHPALPRISDFFSKNDRWYLVMDYIEGETLADVLKKRGSIPESEVRDWGIQLCEILDYLHTRTPPVIFRDLKPSNIMVTPDGKIKLIDFGIARHFRPGSTNDTAAYGSSGYAPPEQYGDNQTDARSDIYALGAVLHHLLTDKDPIRTPFNFESPGKTTAVSPALESVIMKALELKPSDRPGTVGEMLTLLREAGSAQMGVNRTETITPSPGGSQTPTNATTAIGMGAGTRLITPGQGDAASSDAMISCPTCGKELSRNASFCRHCGAQIDSNPANSISGTEEKTRYFKWIAAVLGVLLLSAGAYGFYAWNNTGTSQALKPQANAKTVPPTTQLVNPPAQPISPQPPAKENQSTQKIKTDASGGKSVVTERNRREPSSKSVRNTQSPANAAKPLNEKPDTPDKPAVSSRKKSGFTVQVCSSSLRSEAEMIKNKLANKGYGTYISESDQGDIGIWYRVRVGKMLDQDAAKELATKFGKGAIVIPDGE